MFFSGGGGEGAPAIGLQKACVEGLFVDLKRCFSRFLGYPGKIPLDAHVKHNISEWKVL